MSTTSTTIVSSVLSSTPKQPWKRPNTNNNNPAWISSDKSTTNKSSNNTNYSNNNNKYSNYNKNSSSTVKNNSSTSSSSSSSNNKYTPYRSNNNNGYFKKKEETIPTPESVNKSADSTITPPTRKTTVGIGGTTTEKTAAVAVKTNDAVFETLPIDMRYKLFHADVQTRLALRRIDVDATAGINFFIQGVTNNYIVRLGKQTGRWSCTCKDYQKLCRCERNCKHIYFIKLRVLGNARIMPVWTDGDIQGFVRMEKVKSNLFIHEPSETNPTTTTTTLSSSSAHYRNDEYDSDNAEPIVAGTKLDLSILSLHADHNLCNRILRGVQRHMYEYEQHGLKGNPKYLFPLIPRPSDVLYAQSRGEDMPPRPYYPSVGIPEVHLNLLDAPIYDSDNSNNNNEKRKTSPKKTEKKRERSDDEDEDEDQIEDDEF